MFLLCRPGELGTYIPLASSSQVLLTELILHSWLRVSFLKRKQTNNMCTNLNTTFHITIEILICT
jgi:hypothetical protein